MSSFTMFYWDTMFISIHLHKKETCMYQYVNIMVIAETRSYVGTEWGDNTNQKALLQESQIQYTFYFPWGQVISKKYT